MKKVTAALLMMCLALSVLVSGGTTGPSAQAASISPIPLAGNGRESAPAPVAGADPFEAYYDAIDTDYSMEVMNTLIGFGTNETYGFRTAGSPAELAAADYLAGQMEAIGLSNVTQEAVTVDTFTFKSASLTYTDVKGESVTIPMAMFQTTCQVENKPVEVIYLGQGTAADYEGVDAAGKLVLLDINQYDDWWINWPAYQAKVKGAAGVIAVNVDGYCTYSEETVGVQDYCGPSDAPAFTISVAQAAPLKAAIEAGGGSVQAVLDADGLVERDGVGYCVMGEIPGKTDEAILVFAHYDAYFRAFSDNTSGIGCAMGIAKALVESGYQPRRTIGFIAHCAEEWGLDNSRYDWARGSTVLVQSHPEWSETTFMAVNLDGDVIDGGAQGVEVTIPYELAAQMKEIGASVEGSPFAGEFRTNSPAWTWTEAFGYTVAGIPVLDSGLYGSDHTGSYHSSSDTAEANNYSPEVFQYGHKLYGSFVLAFDQLAVRDFDFTALFEAMSETVDESVIENAAGLQAALDGAGGAAALLSAKNREMAEAGDTAQFNKDMNDLFKTVSNELFSINWNEEFRFVHQYKQDNVAALRGAIACLEAGDVAGALDDYLWMVDLNWYAYSFDKETCDFFVDQVLGEDARNSWGAGYLTTHADLWEVIQSLMGKAGQEGADVSGELEALRAELAVQQADLNAVVGEEIVTLQKLTKVMEALAK